MRTSLARTLTAVLALLVMLVQGTWVLAGTTGSISGVLTDAAAGTPVTGARISAVSPSQAAQTTTDAQGRYSFLSLAPDTYTINFDKAGYQSTGQSGVTVQADQTLTVNLTGAKALQNIGRTASRASNSNVRPGVTASVYSINPTAQAAAAPLGGGANLDQAYSAIASVPGVTVPIGQPGWGTSIFIRGGDYTQTGNEVDGIPINRAFDQYAASSLSALGNQEVQVYTGNSPADAQAVGLAGYINQVIKTGTYPGYANATLGLGSPSFYHKANIEFGGASPNRNFSYYLATGGYTQDLRVVNQYNGAGYVGSNGYGSLYNFVATNCGTAHPSSGCYANSSPFLGGIPYGPNGYAVSDLLFGSAPATTDREGIANFHIGIPHGKNGLRDDVQLLYNIGQIFNEPNDSMNGFGPYLGDVQNGTVGFGAIPNVGNIAATDASCQNGDAPTSPTMQVGPVTCAGAVNPTYIDQNQFTGPLGQKLSAGNLGNIKNYYFSGSPQGRVYNAPISLSERDGETNGFAIVKGQYQHQFSDKAYARVYGYSLYSDRIDNGIVGLYQNYLGAFSSDYAISSHARGVALASAYQITAQHLLQLDLGYTTANVVRYRNDTASGAGESPVAYLVDSSNPTGGCYNQTADPKTGAPLGIVQVACGNAAQYRLPGIGGTSLVARKPIKNAAGNYVYAASPTLGAEAGLSCGTSTCEYLAVNDGRLAARNTVSPRFSNFAVSDTWKPTANISVDLSLRSDTFTYGLQDTNTPANQLFTNDYNASHCISGTTIKAVAYGAACPAGFAQTQLSAASPSTLTYAHFYQPRLGATYTINPYNVLRASYGRFVQPAETSAVQATNVQGSAPSAPFYSNFGFTSYARSVEPEVSYNSDFTWEHQVRNSDLSFRLTPFQRKTVNEFATILVDPKTNFVASVNGQNRTASGLEFALNKGDFSRDGVAAQLAYTYTYAYNRYKVFPTGGSFVTGINNAITAYNAFTKSGGGAPCYTTAGDADAACASGSVANPYYNTPAAGLLDPNGKYFPYNQAPGFGNGASASYLIPHVASLIVQYKRGPLHVTPSFQFQAGSRYGSPLASGGVAPNSCGSVLAGTTANDPRYPVGAAGGSPYNAASCATAIAVPDPYTGKFDGIGEFRQPSLILGNLQIGYDFNKRLSLQVTAANVVGTCFGGSKVPWNGGGRLGCNYSNTLAAGNFYNPGDQIQSGFAYPYGPTLAGSLQSVPTSAINPFQLYFELKLHKI